MTQGRIASILVALVATGQLLTLVPADALAANRGVDAPFDLEAPTWTARVEDGTVVGVEGARTTRGVLAEVAARGWDVTPSDLLAATARLWADAGTPAVALGAEGTTLAAFPMPDATGDGLADVVSVELAEIALRMTLRAGGDASPVWTRELGAVAALAIGPTRDMTGDGLGDLLLVTMDAGQGGSSEQCAEDAQTCFLAFAGASSWRLVLISGADGSSVWTREEPALAAGGSHITFSWDPSLLANTGAGIAMRVALVPALMDDRDGDGIRDLILHEHNILYANTHTSRWDEPAAHSASGGSYQLITHASLVDGATGAQVPLRTYFGAHGEGALLPIGHAVGDSAQDLAWWTSEVRSIPASACAGEVCAPRLVEDERILTIEMIDGATLTRAWSVERPLDEGRDAAYVGALLADATGDGRADVYVREETTFSLDPPRLALVSGVDGTEAWSASAFWAFALGAIDADSGAIVALSSHAIVEGGVLATIARVDGATGSQLHVSDRFVPFPDGFGYVLVSVKAIGRVDADLVDDVVFGTVSSSFLDTTSRWSVESGATGASLHEHVAPRHAALVGAGDLDADGAADVYLAEYDGDYWSGVFTLRATSLRDGDLLWERVDAPEGSAPRAWIIPAGDVGGGPGDDLLYGIATGWGDEVDTGFRGLHGLTGAEFWALG